MMNDEAPRALRIELSPRALIFIATALALAAILLVTIPPLVAQLQHILEDLPQERSKVIRFLGQYQLGAPFVKTVRAIPLDSIVVKAGDALLGYSGQILTALGYAVTTIFLALYLLAEPPRAQGLLYALVSRHHHVKLAQILRGLKQNNNNNKHNQQNTSIAIAIFTFGLLSAF